MPRFISLKSRSGTQILSCVGLKDGSKNIHSNQHARADRQQTTNFALFAVIAQGVSTGKKKVLDGHVPVIQYWKWYLNGDFSSGLRD